MNLNRTAERDVATSSAAPEEQKPIIHRHVENLDIALQSLQQTAATLEKRLAPVMAPIETDSGKQHTQGPPASPLTEALSEHVSRIDGVTDRLGHILIRLEI